jgi:hypothetical protein
MHKVSDLRTDVWLNIFDTSEPDYPESADIAHNLGLRIDIFTFRPFSLLFCYS